MVNIAFTLTPMPAPGSVARLTLFRLTGTHYCCSTWGGSVFILVFRQECVPMQRCTLRLSVLWHNSIGSLFLSTYTTLDILFSDFSLSPVLTAEDFGIVALLRDRLLARCLLRLLIIIRPDTPSFLTGEEMACFSGPFVPCFFLGISWQLDSAPSTLLSGAVALALIPTRQAEKTLLREKVWFPMTSPTSYVPSSHKVTFVKGYIPSAVHGLLKDRASGFR